jgi:hypothetical protein
MPAPSAACPAHFPTLAHALDCAKHAVAFLIHGLVLLTFPPGTGSLIGNRSPVRPRSARIRPYPL